MNDITERVARAIDPHVWENWDNWVAVKSYNEAEKAGEFARSPTLHQSLAKAERAIAAMREPTEWMLIVGQAAMPEHDEPLQEDALATWQAMIDKALE